MNFIKKEKDAYLFCLNSESLNSQEKRSHFYSVYIELSYTKALWSGLLSKLKLDILYIMQNCTYRASIKQKMVEELFSVSPSRA